MNTLLSRFLRTPVVKTLTLGALALTVGYALA